MLSFGARHIYGHDRLENGVNQGRPWYVARGTLQLLQHCGKFVAIL